MKVLMIGPCPLPGEAARGGVQAATEALVLGLGGVGSVSLRVLVLRPGLDAPREVQRGPISILYVPHRDRRPAYTLYRSARAAVAAEVARWSPDVVHAQGLEAEGFAASRLRGPKRVVTPHGNLLKDEFQNSRSWKIRLRGMVRHALAISAVRQVDAAIAVGHPKDNLAYLAPRVFEVPNPLRPEFLVAAIEPPAARRILVSAAVRPIKGIEIVLRAASAASATTGSIEVCIAGVADDAAYRDDLIRLAASLPGVTVTWLGQLGPVQLRDAMDACSTVALGSLWEIAPVCVQEAMARRRLVVAPRLAGIERLTAGGTCAMLFEPGSHADMASRLRDAFASPEAVARIVEAAWHIARERFASGPVATALAGVYAELMEAS